MRHFFSFVAFVVGGASCDGSDQASRGSTAVSSDASVTVLGATCSPVTPGVVTPSSTAPHAPPASEPPPPDVAEPGGAPGASVGGASGQMEDEDDPLHSAGTGSNPSARRDAGGARDPEWNGDAGRHSDAGLPELTEPALDAGRTVDAAASPGVLTRFRLAVIGSSTSAGEGASRSEYGWVSLLGESLEQSLRVDFELHNLSVGGLASDALVPGADSCCNVDGALERGPDLLLVALAGSNDLSVGTNLDEFLERLSRIREAAREGGVPVFFVSTAPKDLSDDEREALRDWALAMQNEFDPCWVPRQDASHSPCFIDVFDALANDSLGIASEYGSGDGIHLNDEGHAVIFRIAEEIVRPYVCSVAPCE